MNFIRPRRPSHRAGTILVAGVLGLSGATLSWATLSARADDGAIAFGAVGNLSVEINWGALDTLGPPRLAPAPGPVLFVPIVTAVVEQPRPGAVTVAVSELTLPVPVPPMPAPPPAPAAQPAAQPAAPDLELVPELELVPDLELAPEPEPEPVVAALAEPVLAEPVPAEPLEGAAPLPATTLAPAPAEPEPLDDTEVAGLGPTTGPLDLTTPGPVLAVAFAAEDAELGPETIHALDALVVAMLADDGARIQLMAYAGAESGSASAARRLSLSRALAVRGYLIERGVRSTRIDVRALGDNVDVGPPERVDIVALPR
ncbi:MAG: OmpA family protein [Alphaproteobacteria bacterium]